MASSQPAVLEDSCPRWQHQLLATFPGCLSALQIWSFLGPTVAHLIHVVKESPFHHPNMDVRLDR